MSSRNVIKGKKLYKVLFFGVIFVVAAIGTLAYWGVREVRHDAAVVAVESSARGVAGAVTVLVNAVTSANEEIGTDFLTTLDPDALRHAITKLLKRHPELTSIGVSDGTGLRYALTSTPDGLLEIQSEGDGGKPLRRTLWKGDVPEIVKSKRPVDQKAMNDALIVQFEKLIPGQVSWRSSVHYFNFGESWLTASVLDERSGKNYMISYFFPIDAVVSRLGGAEKGSAEKIFLFWESGKVLPITDSKETRVLGDRASRALDVDDITDPVIAAATRVLILDSKARTVPFKYVVDNEFWWAYVMPLSVFGDTLSLGVAVPWKNIVSTLTSDTFLQIFGGILAFVAFCVLFILYRNRSRIEAIGLRQKAAKTAEDVLRLIADGESNGLEFKQTLRFNLKAGKNGKEIEHASMKSVAGFMNSEGGTLLVGVADNGLVTGFEEDQLGSDDKALLHFNNLVNQYVGAEFSRYIDTAIIEVHGKQVIRAYCMPAVTPAILKYGQCEEFYVRSGPASRQLTLSQFYEWVQNR